MASKLLFLVGPTATGKSDVAVAIAPELQAEILSLDSMQVYRGMDIGTAKIPLAERREIPHHLLDLTEPSQSFTVAEYKARAERTVEEIRARGKRPLFVGGTAFYLKVLTAGLFSGASMDPAIREELQARADREGNAALHEELRQVDPVAADRIHPNDRKRVIRALEVFRMTGSPISRLQREWAAEEKGVPRAIVGLRMEKELLNRRIEERVNRMFEAGLVEEVQGIGEFGPQSSQALGYREVLQHLEGEMDLEECRALIVKKTRTFARRQMTWLRSFPEIHWLAVEEETTLEELGEEALAWFQKLGT